jgi:hypothetical protein
LVLRWRVEGEKKRCKDGRCALAQSGKIGTRQRVGASGYVITLQADLRLRKHENYEYLDKFRDMIHWLLYRQDIHNRLI